MTQAVHDLTGQCGVRKARLRASDICALWIHRVGIEVGTDAVGISRWFTHGDGARYTGGQMPYHYVVTYHEVQQALPLDERGAHARRWGNAHGIGIAVQGDFRSVAPSPEQWAMTTGLCADLLMVLSPIPPELLERLPITLLYDLPIYGHGEVPIAYGRDGEKRQPDGKWACPGKLWHMLDFRRSVRTELRRRGAVVMLERGHRVKWG